MSNHKCTCGKTFDIEEKLKAHELTCLHVHLVEHYPDEE